MPDSMERGCILVLGPSGAQIQLDLSKLVQSRNQLNLKESI